MGNGNGLISYGKSRALTPEKSLTDAILELKKNIIAIPLDPACTMPRPIHQKFQDYNVYLRPLPGFNSFGHPVFSTMFALTGIQHGGFVTVHTGKNNYTMLHSLFKAVTKNTTPQDLAELEGFKLYRHRFIRPLTEKPTHNNLSWWWLHLNRNIKVYGIVDWEATVLKQEIRIFLNRKSNIFLWRELNQKCCFLLTCLSIKLRLWILVSFKSRGNLSVFRQMLWRIMDRYNMRSWSQNRRVRVQERIISCLLSISTVRGVTVISAKNNFSSLIRFLLKRLKWKLFERILLILLSIFLRMLFQRKRKMRRKNKILDIWLNLRLKVWKKCPLILKNLLKFCYRTRKLCMLMLLVLRRVGPILWVNQSSNSYWWKLINLRGTIWLSIKIREDREREQ